MSRKWKRDIQVQAGPLTIEPRTEAGENKPLLKIKFDITKSNNREANKAEVVIWNLNAESRSLLQEKDLEVVVKAGYIDSIAQIFKGDMERAVNVKEAVEWTTTLEVGDGSKNLQQARINKSFRGPQKPGQMLKEAAEALGLDVGNLKDQVSKDGERSVLKQFLTNVVLSGKASDVLDEVASSMGLNYSIQDKKIQLLPKGGALKTPAIDVSVSTGLLGSPKIGEKGTLSVASLLDPRMVPGQKINLVAAAVEGEFVIQEVRHNGDTWGADWTTTMEAKPS